jgi:hypothetical protein
VIQPSSDKPARKEASSSVSSPESGTADGSEKPASLVERAQGRIDAAARFQHPTAPPPTASPTAHEWGNEGHTSVLLSTAENLLPTSGLPSAEAAARSVSLASPAWILQPLAAERHARSTRHYNVSARSGACLVARAACTIERRHRACTPCGLAQGNFVELVVRTCEVQTCETRQMPPELLQGVSCAD